MPYIENEEEAARSAMWKSEREAKQKPLREGFDCLTIDQQQALMYIFKTLDNFNDENRDMEGDCYHSTWIKLTGLYGKIITAFPNVRDEEGN